MRAGLGRTVRSWPGSSGACEGVQLPARRLPQGPPNWQDLDSEEWSPRSRRAQKHPDLQVFMARGGVEPPTPRFSVKELEAMVWPWLQGLS